MDVKANDNSAEGTLIKIWNASIPANVLKQTAKLRFIDAGTLASAFEEVGAKRTDCENQRGRTHIVIPSSKNQKRMSISFKTNADIDIVDYPGVIEAAKKMLEQLGYTPTEDLRKDESEKTPPLLTQSA